MSYENETEEDNAIQGDLYLSKKAAKKILYENVIGVNQEKLEAHHDFLPSVLKAMESYAQSLTQELQDKVKLLEGENERLKGLISSAWHQAITNCEVENGEGEPCQEFVSWQQFKTDNNLEGSTPYDKYSDPNYDLVKP